MLFNPEASPEVSPEEKIKINEIKKMKRKEFLHSIVVKIQKVGFWIFIIFCIGVSCGIFISKIYGNSIVEEAINLEKFSHLDSNYSISYIGPKKRFIEKEKQTSSTILTPIDGAKPSVKLHP